VLLILVCLRSCLVVSIQGALTYEYLCWSSSGLLVVPVIPEACLKCTDGAGKGEDVRSALFHDHVLKTNAFKVI
jgi:hypothetical protein